MINKINEKSREKLENSLVNYTNDIGAAYLNRALCYEKLGENELAQNDNKMAKELCEEHEYYYHLAFHYQHNKMPELAIENYTKAINAKSNDGAYYKNRASLFQEIGKFEEAINDYQKVLELETSLNWVRNGCELEIIHCHIKQGNYDKALQLCEEREAKRAKYIDIQIDIPKCRIKIYEALGEYEKALKYAKELLDNYECWAQSDEFPEEDGDFDGLFTRQDMYDTEQKILELEEKLA